MSEYVEGRLLAKLKFGVDIDDLREIIPSAKVLGTPGGIHLISFEDSPVIDEVKRLEESGLVEYAQPDHVYNAFLPTPYHSNDPYYADGNQWALFNQGQNGGVAGADIRAPYAWRILYESGKPIGSSAVKVGVIDTGVDYNHPDLSGNCKKADGFDFYNTDSDPMDDGDHGTHVAGIIGATGNNGTGVSGVAWACRIYPIKALNSSMQATDTSILYSLDHADMMGCHIVNMSFGSYSFSQAVANAIAGMTGVLFVCAAGNDASDNDASPVYPASLGFNNIISVCNTNNKDQLNSYSNYGATSVHVGAPGSNICSTFPGGIYLWMSGTSMAAPVVTGIAVLLKAAFPALTVAQIRSQILDNVDVIPALSGKCSTGGRVNAYKAFSGLLVDPEVEIGIRSQCAIREAQNDGEYYGRMNGAWVKLPVVEYTAGDGVSIAGSEIGLDIFDESGVVSSEYLPSSLTGSLIYKGGFDPTVASPSPAAQGWYFIAVASGEVAGVQFYENDWIVYRDEYIFDKISNSSSSIMWGNVVGKPETYPPVVGETSTDAYRGDRGAVAYSHALSPHAPRELPTATDSVLGGVKVGSRLTITDGVLSADEQGGGLVKVSSNDTTAGYLNGKLVAGTNITLTEGSDGENETLTIASTGSSTIVSGGSATLVQRSLEGVVYETTLMYWRAPAACTINSVSMSLSSNPSATGSYCKVQVMKNGLQETDSIFSSDTPMQVTESTTASNGIYTASGTLDTGNDMDDLAEGDVVHFRVNQADTGSADLLVQMVVSSPDFTGTLDGGSA